ACCSPRRTGSISPPTRSLHSALTLAAEEPALFIFRSRRSPLFSFLISMAECKRTPLDMSPVSVGISQTDGRLRFACFWLQALECCESTRPSYGSPLLLPQWPRHPGESREWLRYSSRWSR